MSSTDGGRVTRIMAVLRTVPDLAAAELFYRSALGFTTAHPAHDLGPDEAALLGAPGARVERLVLRLGAQTIAFLRFEPEGRPYPPDSTASDLWFQHCAVVVADMDKAFERVSRHAIHPLSLGGPQQLPAATGGVRAFKFRDPFGHPLELLWLPPGTGDAVWHAGRPETLEGIDHTAIAVSDADASARFYRDVIGLAPGNRSHNQGVAQDYLDALPGDDVDVVALMPATAPPHLELLGYRTGTRRRLEDATAADASVSRTVAMVENLDTVWAALERHVPSSATVRRGRWRGQDAVTFLDPDAHAWICTAD